MSTTNSWDGILEPGEEIIWQGQPDGTFRFVWFDAFTGIFGAAFAGFALFWMLMASAAGGGFWMFGLIHFAVGIGIMLGRPALSWWSRRHSFYSLSNRRAFIASDYPIRGRVLQSWPISRTFPMRLAEGRLDNVIFAEKPVQTKNGQHMRPIGFDGIREGRKVLALLQSVQREMRLAKGEIE